MARDDRGIAETFLRERSRLQAFIRRRVRDPADVEDLLQEVFSEFVEAARLARPIERVGAWLFRVARNRIIDQFRKRKLHREQSLDAPLAVDESGEGGETWEDLLPSVQAGPEAAYARRVLLEEVADALEELPEEQRSVFVQHEIDGLSFKEIAQRTGVGVNTLLSRKHYAVMHLRRRLLAIQDDFPFSL